MTVLFPGWTTRRKAKRAMGEPRNGIKRYLPRTLFGRSLVIIVTPVLLMQMIATFVFYDRHWDTMTRRLSEGVAGDIALVVDLTRGADAERRRAVYAAAAQTTKIIFAFHEGATFVERPFEGSFSILRTQMNEALLREINRPYTIDLIFRDEWTRIQVQLNNGVLIADVPRRRLFSTTSVIFILWMIGSGVVLFLVAILFMRNQIRPIRRLAIAADSFGRGLDAPGFKPEGAAEVRQASRAFLIMRERIQRQITQRTEMLAGVSHDLRTPLTRMKLQLAMLGDGPEINELRADVTDMETMIGGYLAFARGDGAEEPVPTDLAALLNDVVTSARREGAIVEFDSALPVDPPLILSLRPQACKRGLANLLSNARRYADTIWVHAALRGTAAEVIIDDDGPGVPEDQVEDVFRPFHRLEPSRNPQTGGVGLGLTIARDVARGHGGELQLGRSPYGGLRCVMRLPV